MKENQLINAYKELILDQLNFNKLVSSSKDNSVYNKIYYNIYNTNFRSLFTLRKYVWDCSNLINLSKLEWPKYENNNQDKNKQKIPILKQYNIIFNSSNDRILWTKRGEILFNLLKFSEFYLSWGQSESFLLWIFHILSSKEVKRTLFYFDQLELFFDSKEFNFQINKIIQNSSIKLIELMKNDLFVFHSFFGFSDFLKLYFNSEKEEKDEFKEYLILNYKKKNINCPIYKKYKTAGTFTKSTFIEEWTIFYLILNFSKINEKDLLKDDVFVKLINIVKNLFPLKKHYNNILEYLNKNKDIYLILIRDAFLEDYYVRPNPESLNIVNQKKELDIVKGKIEYKPKLRIDDTYEYGRKKIQKEFLKMKPIIREIYSYKCALEKINQCKYFKSKNTNENYIEVHHLIPRSQSMNFENSIEVPANYIPLCANCHRLVHQAIKYEREKILTVLYDLNKEKLKQSGLFLQDKEKLFEMYE